MKKKKSESDYDVGYRKPPKHTQFKPGKSGNPKGRPKGRKNYTTIVREALAKKVAVSEGGRVREVSYAEAVLMALAAKALKGDVRAAESLLRLMQQHLAGGDEAESGSAIDPEIVIQFIDAKGRPKSIGKSSSDGKEARSSLRRSEN
ncbi:DUF5681 domain-containing protein [Methyloceanibacter sp.]|uniref:DUF5681 domain-containing protein n=1 Tax=Methyloceanibacter sp. TaxID=1965321 RepID=UPI002BE6AD7C|nr:DUF5681 domain-containing protein [Methyloceanibacter sp.]HML90851.1 DUF5681 domain-containing protein [Methyloceanibacter sp.]